MKLYRPCPYAMRVLRFVGLNKEVTWSTLKRYFSVIPLIIYISLLPLYLAYITIIKLISPVWNTHSW